MKSKKRVKVKKSLISELKKEISSLIADTKINCEWGGSDDYAENGLSKKDFLYEAKMLIEDNIETYPLTFTVFNKNLEEKSFVNQLLEEGYKKI